MKIEQHRQLYERRRLYEIDGLLIGQVIARPWSVDGGGLECEATNLLALPISGVFTRHDGPRRHVLATPNHAVMLSAGVPYRISFPGCIGDLCLMLAVPAAVLSRWMPCALAGDAFDTKAFDDHALLPARTMLATRRLRTGLLRAGADPLDVEEAAMQLVTDVLRLARRDPRRRADEATRDPRRRARQVERVKEAITVDPARRWTLDELAGIACVSPHHLVHTFQRDVGTSVYRYVLRTRLALALDRVLGDDDDLSRIAFDSGFSSHSHFTSRFRAFFGITPRSLRLDRQSVDLTALRGIASAPAATVPFAR